MPDQMRGDCLSAVGHPVVKTPTLDALAEEGMLFRRAYSTVPSCIPARYAMLTGLYPGTSGVVGFKQKPVDSPTMPQVLRDAGYETALVGRNMHQSNNSAELGYTLSVLGSTYISNDEYTKALSRAMPDMGDIHDLGRGSRADLQRLASPALAARQRPASHDLGRPIRHASCWGRLPKIAPCSLRLHSMPRTHRCFRPRRTSTPI